MAGKTLHCCLFCGRDTTSRAMICFKCLGRSRGAGPGEHVREHVANESRPAWPDELLSDNYDDISGPDSIYNEHTGIHEEGFHRGEGR